jgi:integrase
MASRKLTDAFVRKTAPPSKRVRQLEIWDTEAPGLSLRIGHGGKRSFYVTVRVKGKSRRRYKLGNHPELTLLEARDQTRVTRANARKGIDPREHERELVREAERARLNTFGAVATQFVEDHAKKAAPKSWSEVERKIRQDLLPDWETRPIASITRQDVRKLIREKARKAPVSANRLLSLVKQILAWAVDEDYLDASPAVKITPEPEIERERVLDDDEIKALWAAFETEGYPFGPLFKLLLITGQRRGEVAGMKRSELRGDDWRLPASRTKSDTGHLVPLPLFAQEIIDETPNLGDHLFTSGRARPESSDVKAKAATGEQDRPVVGFRRAKARCDKLSKVEDWHLHDLRRTAATGMTSLGVDRLIVSKVLNHAEGGITRVYDRYAADPEKRIALDRWAQHLKTIIEGKKPAKVVKLRG